MTKPDRTTRKEEERGPALDVIVIGAGIAGLTAASELVRQGYRVKVLEARDRVGGRVWSTALAGQTVDLGAQWLEGTLGNPLVELCESYGVEHVPWRDEIAVADGAGVPLASDEIESVEEVVEATLEATRRLAWDTPSDDDLSLAEAFHRCLPEDLVDRDRELACWLVDVDIGSDEAEDLDKISLRCHWDEDVDDTFGGESRVFPNGFGELARGLARGLDVELESEVREIAFGVHDAVVTTQRGTCSAKRVLVTLPVGVLKVGSVRFVPPLPASKVAAIASLGTGVTNKIFLAFDEAFWPEHIEFFGLAAQESELFVEVSSLLPSTGRPILIVWSHGERARAVEALADDVVTSRALATLERLFGAAPPRPRDVLVTRWGRDPHARGSYAHMPVGSTYAAVEVLRRARRGHAVLRRRSHRDGAHRDGPRCAFEWSQRSRGDRGFVLEAEAGGVANRSERRVRGGTGVTCRNRNWRSLSTPVDRRRFLRGAGAVLGAGVLQACGSDQPVADLILDGARVLTLDDELRQVEALAIKNGFLLAVGSSDEVELYRGRETRTVDLRDHTIIPGINDSHLHALSWGLGQPPLTLDLSYPGVSSIAEVVNRVGERAREVPPGSWIVGRGWDQSYFSEQRAPTRFDLDAVASEHPVVLTEFSGHAVWVNSAAMQAAGVTAASEVSGGHLVRDADGRLTGVLFERATSLIWDALPPVDERGRRQALELAMDTMLDRGITSFTDPGVDLETARLYDSVIGITGSNRVLPRATLLLRAGASVASLEPLLDFELSAVTDPLRLRVAGIKIMGDGIPTANGTAWLHEPYVSGGYGQLVIDGATDEERVAELHAMIEAIHEAGLQIGVHATGDRAIDAVVDGYAKALEVRPRRAARHYVIHADLASPATLARMAEKGVGANFNPEIKHLIADGQVAAIGEERAAYEWPYRTALDLGVNVASSSDAPVTPGDWRQGVTTCVMRQGLRSGEVSGPGQRITLDEALVTYTRAGAWQDSAETDKGTLEVGLLADLCVLEGDLIETPIEQIPEVEVVATFVGGVEV